MNVGWNNFALIIGIFLLNVSYSDEKQILENELKLENPFLIDFYFTSTSIHESRKRGNDEERRGYRNDLSQTSSNLSISKKLFDRIKFKGFFHHFHPTQFTRYYTAQDYEVYHPERGFHTSYADEVDLELERSSFSEYGGALTYQINLAQGHFVDLSYAYTDRSQKQERMYYHDQIGHQHSFDLRYAYSIYQNTIGLGFQLNKIEASFQSKYRFYHDQDKRYQETSPNIDRKEANWGETRNSSIYFFGNFKFSQNFHLNAIYSMNTYHTQRYEVDYKYMSLPKIKEKIGMYETQKLNLSFNYLTQNNSQLYLRMEREGADSSFGLIPATIETNEGKIKLITTSFSVGIKIDL